MRNLQPVELLKKGLSELGITFTEEQGNAFMTYLSELKKWNRAYNLTGLKTDEDIIIKHFLESAALSESPAGWSAKGRRYRKRRRVSGNTGQDYASGNRNVSHRAYGEKNRFSLRHITRHLHLNDINVIEKRVEDTKVSDEIPSPVDAAVTRALFDVREFIKKGVAYCPARWDACLSKGPKAEEEVRELREVKYEVLPFTLPLSNMQRQIIVINLPKCCKRHS